MSDNLRIWNALRKTDPAHTKRFTRAGGFSGTSIKPIYMVEKMTALFGPCGIGWGMTEPNFQVVQLAEEIAVYCTVGLWYDGAGDSTRATVYGVGGDFVAKRNKNGLFADDEAFKKAYTDALSNAMKQLGVGADVHMGRHDDDKYVAELQREFTAAKAAPPKARDENKADERTEDHGDGGTPSNGVPAAIAFRDRYVNAVKGSKEMQDLVALAQKHGAALTKLREKYPALMTEIERAIATREAAFNPLGGG